MHINATQGFNGSETGIIKELYTPKIHSLKWDYPNLDSYLEDKTGSVGYEVPYCPDEPEVGYACATQQTILVL